MNLKYDGEDERTVKEVVQHISRLNIHRAH